MRSALTVINAASRRTVVLESPLALPAPFAWRLRIYVAVDDHCDGCGQPRVEIAHVALVSTIDGAETSHGLPLPFLPPAFAAEIERRVADQVRHFPPTSH